MLDMKCIREQSVLVREKLLRRGAVTDLDRLLAADARRREVLQLLEKLRADRNLASESIARMKRERAEVDPARFQEIKDISANIKPLEDELKQIEQETGDMLMAMPNLPHDSVPPGSSEADNLEVRRWGAPPQFSFAPREHDEIGQGLGILDFERATKLAGARFSLQRGDGALLERALINFMLDLHTRTHRYIEMLTPLMVNRQAMTGTGQLPKFEADLFKVAGTDYFLIPTAEVPLTNIHQKEILCEEELPISYTAYTPCFRSEAGSYGRDTRGLIRQHQFNKVELVKFTRPEDSYAELDILLDNAEEVLRRLNIAYRVVCLCAGDLGFSAAKTFDIEAWLPGQGAFREISSCSNFEDFQSRRAGIRFRRTVSKKVEFVHTLNGSGLAVGRTLVAILENYQQADGSVVVPAALRPYMGGVEHIRPPAS